MLAERLTGSDLGLCQAKATSYEEPMVETTRMAATLPGLRRTDIRALQRQGKRRGDLPNTVGLFIMGFLRAFPPQPPNKAVFALRPWSHCWQAVKHCCSRAPTCVIHFHKFLGGVLCQCYFQQEHLSDRTRLCDWQQRWVERGYIMYAHPALLFLLCCCCCCSAFLIGY